MWVRLTSIYFQRVLPRRESPAKTVYMEKNYPTFVRSQLRWVWSHLGGRFVFRKWNTSFCLDLTQVACLTSYRPPLGLAYLWSFEKAFKKLLRIFIQVNQILQKQTPEVFYKKGVVRNFTKFTRKHLCQSLFFNKVAGLQLYLKRDSATGVFLWILWNF